MTRTKLLVTLTALAATLLLAAAAMAAEPVEYHYITPDELKYAIDNDKPMHVVDIQVQEEYDAHHIACAVPTYAYPVKTAEDKAKLAALVDELKNDESPIVIVCPRGAGGAERAYQTLMDMGICDCRLYILKGGQAEWPYPEMLGQ